MEIRLIGNDILILVGAMGTGKSTFCKNNIPDHFVVSSDNLREQMTGDFECLSYDTPVWNILYTIVQERAKAGLPTVIDSTGSGRVINKVMEISKRTGADVKVLKFPHLKEEEITESRMKHRMKYIEAYYRHKDRIDRTEFPKTCEVFAPTNMGVVSMAFGNDDHILPPEHDYMVFPDLHGESGVLIDHLPSDSTQCVFLGDIVDRGPSSYQTFNLVYNAVTEGRGYAVRGNHDNKFYRWLKKWNNSTEWETNLPVSLDDCATNFSHGLTLSHGMNRTVYEFLCLDEETRQSYCDRFLDFYENRSNPYLTLRRGEVTHYFSHAGITKHLIKGFPIRKIDERDCMYTGITQESFDELICGIDGKMVLHVGHTYFADEITILQGSTNPDCTLVYHDIGLGKRAKPSHLSFMVV